ncbi:MAG: multifunctional acyl-CoA thioesterase and protease and lysophospholipase [Verrucomicrobiaceae bacterium]|nr:multifunctional acyl-CoA thioesterase and protease and lysophospholipase [Verrucomicrobiaceae bacterium]
MTTRIRLLVLAFTGMTSLLPAQTIVAFGDSTTASRGETVVYSSILRDELLFDGKKIKVLNAGIGGNTTKTAKARFDKDVLEAKPEVVVIQFGINDSAVDVWAKVPATKPRVSLEDYRSNLTSMVQTLKQRGARAVLMTSNSMTWTPTLLKLYGKPPYLPDDADGMNVVLRDYVQAVREIAKAEDVGLVDVYEAFQEAVKKKKPGKGLCLDGMHPGDEGHRIVANLLVANLANADKRFARRPNRVWKQSGEVNTVSPFATDMTHDTLGPMTSPKTR